MIRTLILSAFQSHADVVSASMAQLPQDIEKAVGICVESLLTGGKILLFGNGGSACEAQHIAAELTGRYQIERKALPCIALGIDLGALTAIANDYGFEQVFSRQIDGIAQAGDVLIALSTSGNSPNILRALQRGRDLGCRTIGFGGGDGGAMSALCELAIIVPSNETPRIQEMHLLIGHALAQGVEQEYLARSTANPA